MDSLVNIAKSVLGIDADSLSILQVLARCVVIYILGIALVRLGKKRFLGKMAAFDTILAIVIGSLLSRSITDEDGFFETLAACLLLILLHLCFHALLPILINSVITSKAMTGYSSKMAKC